MSGLKPSTSEKSRLQERSAPTSGMPRAPVHLGVAAAGDVEREALGRLLERLHAIRVALLPVVERGGEAREVVAAHLLGELAPLLPRDVDDHVAGDGEHALVAELRAERLQHGHEDARLDLAAPEDADLVQGVGGSSLMGIDPPVSAGRAGGRLVARGRSARSRTCRLRRTRWPPLASSGPAARPSRDSPARQSAMLSALALARSAARSIFPVPPSGSASRNTTRRGCAYGAPRSRKKRFTSSSDGDAASRATT